MNRVFYGWWVLAGVFIAYAASNGIILNTLPLIYPNLIEEFGWTNDEVTRPAQIFLLITAILSPFGGTLLDKYSPRKLMVIGLSIITGALALLPMIGSITQLTMVYLTFSLGLALGGLIASMVVVTRWFVRHRGVAVGLLLMASSFGGAIFPMIMKNTLITMGWREAMFMIAVIGGLMMILPIIFVIRNHPNDKGLNPDGDEQASGEAMSAQGDQVVGGITLQEAVKTPTFYLLAFSTGTLWFCILGVLQHQGIFLSRELRVDPAVIPNVFAVFFWSAIVGKVLFGWLSDHYDKILIMLLAIVNLFIGLLVLRLSSADSLLSVYLYAIIYGCGYSGAFTMIQLAIAEYFSGASYGKILGVFTFVDTIAGSLGVFALARLSDSFGTYLPAFNLMMVLCFVALLCVVWLKRIKDQTQVASQVT